MIPKKDLAPRLPNYLRLHKENTKKNRLTLAPIHYPVATIASASSLLRSDYLPDSPQSSLRSEEKKPFIPTFRPSARKPAAQAPREDRSFQQELFRLHLRVQAASGTP